MEACREPGRSRTTKPGPIPDHGYQRNRHSVASRQSGSWRYTRVTSRPLEEGPKVPIMENPGGRVPRHLDRWREFRMGPKQPLPSDVRVRRSCVVATVSGANYTTEPRATPTTRGRRVVPRQKAPGFGARDAERLHNPTAAEGWGQDGHRLTCVVASRFFKAWTNREPLRAEGYEPAPMRRPARRLYGQHEEFMRAGHALRAPTTTSKSCWLTS